MRAKRMLHTPAAVVEPRPRVGQAHRLKSIEIVDRALEADRRRMDARRPTETPVRAFEADNADLATVSSSRSAM